MTTGLSLPISFLVLHFIGDFLLQSNWMALNKSKSLIALTTHAMVYTIAFVVGLLLLGYPSWNVLLFGWITFVLHWTTDAITSRITSMLWFVEFPTNIDPASKDWIVSETVDQILFPSAILWKSKRHWFFVAIGADQLIHFWLLALAGAAWLGI